MRPRDEVATTRATYDEIGEEYAVLNAELPETVLASIHRFVGALPAGATVADVGCGPARDLKALRARGLRVFGFDLSTGMLRAARTGGVVCADMTRLPVRSGSLDGVWCAASFLHVPREQSRQTLDGFADALRGGGVLHLSVAEGEGEAFEPAPIGAGGNRWFVLRSESELTATLTEVGFSITSVSRSSSHRRWITIGALLGAGREHPRAAP